MRHPSHLIPALTLGWVLTAQTVCGHLEVPLLFGLGVVNDRTLSIPSLVCVQAATRAQPSPPPRPADRLAPCRPYDPFAWSSATNPADPCPEKVGASFSPAGVFPRFTAESLRPALLPLFRSRQGWEGAGLNLWDPLPAPRWTWTPPRTLAYLRLELPDAPGGDPTAMRRRILEILARPVGFWIVYEDSRDPITGFWRRNYHLAPRYETTVPTTTPPRFGPTTVPPGFGPVRER